MIVARVIWKELGSAILLHGQLRSDSRVPLCLFAALALTGVDDGGTVIQVQVDRVRVEGGSQVGHRIVLREFLLFSQIIQIIPLVLLVLILRVPQKIRKSGTFSGYHGKQYAAILPEHWDLISLYLSMYC
mmetsp:Transcript_6551/g.5851  ORF Transcript_6551/g.5851 Transcript_6551/m.5851 type:complete len:130 (-) Transcript_6551:625-1014(-)